MKWVVVALVSCGGARAGVTLPAATEVGARAPVTQVRPNPMPAGACGFDGALSQACVTTPHWAVVAAIARDGPEATMELARARAAPVVAGYPFAIHFDTLQAADHREGIAIVLGLFAKERDATDEASFLHAKLVELAPRADAPRSHVVIEMLEDASAYEELTVDILESRMAHDLAKDVVTRSAWVKTHAGVCTVHRGDVFVVGAPHALERDRVWLPVQCDDHEVFVPGRATRFEAVVLHDRTPMIWQIVEVMCAPVMESRPLGPAPDALVETHMDDDCD